MRFIILVFLLVLSIQAYDCKDMNRGVNDSTGEIKIMFPYLSVSDCDNLTIYKFINKGEISYYLWLQVSADKISFDEREVKILFSDDTEIVREHKIGVKYGDSSYLYVAFIELSSEDLKTFTAKVIKNFKLGEFNQTLFEVTGNKFREHVSYIQYCK